MNNLLSVLLIIYPTIMLINSIVSFMFWKSYKHSLYKLSFILWGTYLINFTLQGVFAQDQFLMALAFSTYFPVALTIRKILDMSIIKHQFGYKHYYYLMGAAFLIAGGLFLAKFEFMWYALPIALAVTLPQITACFHVFKSKEKIDLSTKLLAFFILINALHLLDYPFLRSTNFATAGFSIALVLVFTLSILIPAHIIAVTSKKYAEKLEGELNEQETANLEAKDFFTIFDTKLLNRLKTFQATSSENSMLLSTLSHDLNGALQVISLTNARMERVIQKGSSVEELLKLNYRVRDAAERMISLSQSVRTIQTNNLKGIVADPLTISTSKLSERLQTFYKDKLEQKNIKLKFDFDCEEIHTLGERDIIESSIIQNLIDNAIKFSHLDSEIHLKVISSKPDFYQIKVTDFGVGLTDEQQKDIFDIKSSKSTPGTMGEKGTGFGLPITRNYAQLYGGNIEVRSQKDKETTFTVTLKKEKQSLQLSEVS